MISVMVHTENHVIAAPFSGEQLLSLVWCYGRCRAGPSNTYLNTGILQLFLKNAKKETPQG